MQHDQGTPYQPGTPGPDDGPPQDEPRNGHDPDPEPPGQRLISRRALLASGGLVAGTVVATVAGIEIVGPLI